MNTLPLVDLLVLDEADRMIADGHFKEMRDILAHIYTQRLLIKTNKIGGGKPKQQLPKTIDSKNASVVELGDDMVDAAQDSSNFFIGKNLEGEKGKIDMSGIKDLYDDDQILEDMKLEGNILLERNDVEQEEEVDENGKRKKKQKTKSQ